MSHNDIIKYFALCFPTYHERTVSWFQNGKNSVRVRLEDGQEFIFTYHSHKEWKFETVKSFLKDLKGGK